MPFHPAALRSSRTLLRLLLLGIALPCLYWGGASLVFVLNYRTANAALGTRRLAPANTPTSRTRLLVFAPHCDDETLGCAGLMQQTRERGGSVRAVILTNGDAFRTAVERQARSMQVGPDDYIAFAGLRQQETFRALGALGLARQDINFLGYPDRGLMPLWAAHWTPEDAYTSPSTRQNHSPYANTFDPAARYCGADLLRDIKASLRAFRPTLVTVTHPAEDHTDHAAAAAFVTRALAELANDPKEASWAKSCRLAYYLIHRGDWPVPQGSHPTDPLLPPIPLAQADTRWTTLPLTEAETLRKRNGIDTYASQTSLMGSFLRSFVRSSEILGQTPAVSLTHLPETTTPRPGADARTWQGISPLLRDPVRDSVLRDLQGGGDIRALYACRDAQRLYVRLETRSPVSPRFRYTLHLRVFGENNETGDKESSVWLRPDKPKAESRKPKNDEALSAAATIQGHAITAAIPLNDIMTDLPGAARPVSIAVSADTHLANIEIDKTGIRFAAW